MDADGPLRDIVSKYIGIPSSEITPATALGRGAFRLSIMRRRMFASLAEAGFEVPDWNRILTFSDLKAQLKRGKELSSEDRRQTIPSSSDRRDSGSVQNQCSRLAVGIDIEEVSNLPRTDDFRADAFYRAHFSDHEISYCVLQKDPLSCFLGKFAAKEAIVKADTDYMSRPFKEIEILNDSQGRPYCADFSLSISHTSSHAVSIAIRRDAPDAFTGTSVGCEQRLETGNHDGTDASHLPKTVKILVWGAIVLSCLSIALQLL